MPTSAKHCRHRKAVDVYDVGSHTVDVHLLAVRFYAVRWCPQCGALKCNSKPGSYTETPRWLRPTNQEET